MEQLNVSGAANLGWRSMW